MAELEECVICESETGRAGCGEDSLYPVLEYPFEMLELQPDDEIGPLCELCYYALVQVGMIIAD